MFSKSDRINDVTDGKQYNPNVIVSRPMFNKKTIGIDLGQNAKNLKMSNPLENIEFQSGVILIDDDLKLFNSMHYERNLLANLGLQISPTDDIRIIRNKNGEIVAAFAFGESRVNQVKRLRYIDIDSNSSNFKKCMVKLAYLDTDTYNPLRFHSIDQINIERNSILSNCPCSKL